jgi:parvulin-like peptidyl-prolyl isomerase
MWPRAELKQVQTEIYEKIRSSEEEFERAARTQANPTLAAKAGRLGELGRHTLGDEAVEKVAFSLREGEITHVIQSGDSVLVLKCNKRIPPKANVRLEDVRAALEKEVVDKKVQQEYPILFKEMSAKAEPKLFIKTERQQANELMNQVQKDIRPENKQQPGPRPPLGN